MAIFHVWNLVHPNITGLATLLLSMASTKESNFRREILQSNKQEPHNVRFWQIPSFLPNVKWKETDRPLLFWEQYCILFFGDILGEHLPAEIRTSKYVLYKYIYKIWIYFKFKIGQWSWKIAFGKGKNYNLGTTKLFCDLDHWLVVLWLWVMQYLWDCYVKKKTLKEIWFKNSAKFNIKMCHPIWNWLNNSWA